MTANNDDPLYAKLGDDLTETWTTLAMLRACPDGYSADQLEGMAAEMSEAVARVWRALGFGDRHPRLLDQGRWQPYQDGQDESTPRHSPRTGAYTFPSLARPLRTPAAERPACAPAEPEGNPRAANLPAD